MKKRIASLFTLCLIAVSCALPTPEAAPPPVTDPFDVPWEDRSIFKDGLVPSAQSALDALPGASVYHIELKIADYLFHMEGIEEVRYTNTENQPLEEVQFRLFPNILGGQIKVSNLLVDNIPASPRYGLENSLMIVPLAKVLQPGESAIIRMDFIVAVPETVDLNYGVFAYSEDVLALAHVYPMIAVFNDEGWNAEIPPQGGDVAFADASFFLVKVTAPKGVTIVTSGRRISLTEVEQAQTVIVASGPARDFYLAASPNYVEKSIVANGVTIRSYTAPEFDEGSQFVLNTAARALDVFSKRYAPYPYTEFDIVSTPTLVLGIEYPGMIVVTSWLYDIYSGTGTQTLESTVAHEVGHQWFYNLIGGDQLDDPWLDESLTQFATLQYYTDAHGVNGADVFTRSLKTRWDHVGSSPIPIGLPVAAFGNSQTYTSIVYGRGPLFFVALKDVMGEPAFDAFLKEYTQTLSWGISTPEQLQSIAEKNCSCELDEIFNEWVYP